MILLFHIIIALSSIVYATYLFIAPNRARFFVSYCLVAATLASGTYLAILNPLHMAQATISGLFYTAIVTSAIISARYKFTKRVNTNE